MIVSVVTPFDPYYSDKPNQHHCCLYNEHVGRSSQWSFRGCPSPGARASWWPTSKVSPVRAEPSPLLTPALCLEWRRWRRRRRSSPPPWVLYTRQFWTTTRLNWRGSYRRTTPWMRGMPTVSLRYIWWVKQTGDIFKLGHSSAQCRM